MVQKASAKRGRPRGFDPQEALQLVMRRFWQQGFAATSLDDLSEATGLNRPSLYGAFGDKRMLYNQAIELYRERGRQSLASALSGSAPLRQELVALYARAIDTYADQGGQGCFVISTATTEAVHDEQAREALAGTLHEFDAALETRFALAVERGELAAGCDARSLAMVASSSFYAMSLRARAGETRERLAEIAASAVDVLCGRM